MADALIDGGYNVVAVEPNIASHSRFSLLSIEQALEMADVLAILVKHREFLVPPVIVALRSAGGLDFCGALGR